MAGLLSIITTPIGNLADLSPRAAQTLKSAQLILAENTLHSRKLLTAIGVDLKQVKLIACPSPKEVARIPVALERLEAGDHIALISDAGAPSVSDPGGRLIQAIIEARHKIEVIPGPSAVITALMGAGLVTTRFAFLGFLPKKGKDRVCLITDAYQSGLALVIFESPHRISKTLDELHELLGQQKIVVARELTKHFETFHRGVLGSALKPALVEKGEMVIVVEAGKIPPTPPFSKGGSNKRGHKNQARELAGKLGISIKEAYKQLIDAK